MLLLSLVIKLLFWHKEKQLGEKCGACYNPSIGNDCGKCASDLACKPGDPRLPDLPGTCVKKEDLKGNSAEIISNEKLYFIPCDIKTIN